MPSSGVGGSDRTHTPTRTSTDTDVNIDRGGDRADERPLLSVSNLTTVFHTDRETIYAVDDVSFDVYRGETVGIVGESGSGKSVTARSIMGLVDSPGKVLERSSITFKRGELTDLSDKQYQSVRGNGIGMVFQDPQESLNPVFTVGNQIKETLRVNRGITGGEATEEAADLLEAVGIPDARRRLGEYPHEFSGGMLQRAVIAMMLAAEPEFLICDEPTTALDVTIQAQILDLLRDLQEERDLSILFITHDMGVMAEIADRINVMYAGQIVESAPVEELFRTPKHPYTQGLLRSIPGQSSVEEGLETIEGDVPTPNAPATDCRFAPRCPKAFDACEAVEPAHVGVGDVEGHTASCLLYPEDAPEGRRVDRHRELNRSGRDEGGKRS